MSGETWLLLVSVVLGTGGFGAGLVNWWQSQKLKSEKKAVEINAALAVDSAEDKHLLTIIEQQAQHLVTPLRDEVGRLRIEVADLRKALHDEARRYWRLVLWARDMIMWARLYHSNEEGKPPYPDAPEDFDKNL